MKEEIRTLIGKIQDLMQECEDLKDEVPETEHDRLDDAMGCLSDAEFHLSKIKDPIKDNG